ncbi:hypothetical protein CEXT_620041 [Caerostris extrusa]|uniref:Uncharacterized protein n=1 Tax=Caerostris extrusa TaxID=172846 RepID=A0AAV4XZB6_CAEEX|nr:hypothetical protein CEXT_620041 [Caerostris extrusa]
MFLFGNNRILIKNKANEIRLPKGDAIAKVSPGCFHQIRWSSVGIPKAACFRGGEISRGNSTYLTFLLCEISRHGAVEGMLPGVVIVCLNLATRTNRVLFVE